MGYLSIENLYKRQYLIAAVKEWWALEKVHGTSARVSWSPDTKLQLHPGGSESKAFNACFDVKELVSHFESQHKNDTVDVHGEAYGGKILKMSNTYGRSLRFIAFDVKVNGKWLDVPEAERLVLNLNLEFVPYQRIPSTIQALNSARDADSEVAIRNGMGPKKLREGIVIRPIHESIDPQTDDRMIYKHKRYEFSEHKSYKELGVAVMQSQGTIAQQVEDWVTSMRLTHVLERMKREGLEPTYASLANEMVRDVKKESKGELDFDKSHVLEKEIKARAIKLYQMVSFSPVKSFRGEMQEEQAKITPSCEMLLSRKRKAINWSLMPDAARLIAGPIQKESTEMKSIQQPFVWRCADMVALKILIYRFKQQTNEDQLVFEMQPIEPTFSVPTVFLLLKELGLFAARVTTTYSLRSNDGLKETKVLVLVSKN